MPDEDLDLTDIRLKDASELSDPEKGFLKDHQDDLTDEERDAFKDVLAAEPPEEKKPFAFESEDDFAEKTGSVVARILEEREKKKGEPPTPLPEEEKKLGRVFDEGYKAPDWNEPARKIIDRAKEELREETAKEIDERRQALEEVDREIDEEVTKIRATNPDLPAKGTPEGAEFERELAKINVEFSGGVMPVEKAFDIYKMRKGAGGGDELSEEQKKAAAKIGKGGGGTATPPAKKYSDIPKDLDEAEERAVEKFKDMS